MTQEKLTKFPGVHRRADSGIYQFGLRSPVDLAKQFPSGWAVRCTLKTADLREANEKAKVLHAEWSQRFEALRSGKPPTVDVAALRQRLHSVWQGAIARLDATYSVLSKDERDKRAEMSAWQVDDLRQSLRDGYLPLWAEGTAKRHGDPADPVIVTEVGAHLLMLHEVMHEAASDELRTFPLRVRYRREREQAMEAMSYGAPAPVNVTKVVPANGKKIAQAIEAWVTAKQPADKTQGAYLRHSKQFSEMMSDPWLSEVDKTMAIEFRDKLQAWAIAEGKTARTADNVLVSIRALFGVACDKGWLQSNPLARLTIDIGGKETKKREPWTSDELSHLFNDEIWTKRVLPSDRKAGGEAAYWIPLIACYTGARVTEIAQLWTDDVSTVQGKEVIEFKLDREREQKLKNEGSWRAVPMHSELVRLGLCKYVESLPRGPLFPSLPRDGQNGAGGQFSQWFGGFKQRKGFDSPSKAFHSFRHLVASELRLAGATDAQADAITGHAGNGVGRQVYSATIRRQAERLRSVIELLNFPIVVMPLAVS